MAAQIPVLDAEAMAQRIDSLLERVDALHNELRELRQEVVQFQRQAALTTNDSDDIVQRLHGSLKPPSPDMQDDYNDYPDWDWERFSE